MKKIYAFLLAMLVMGGLSAQMLPGDQIVKRAECDLPQLTQETGKIAIIDTLEDYLFRASGAFLFGSQDGGYVMGNGYFDNMGTLIQITDGTGMHYDGVANARVTEVLTWFGAVDITGTPDNVTGSVYSVNADTTPNQLLATGTVTTTDLVGSSQFVYSSIAVTGPNNGDTQGQPFLISIEYAGNDDTLGIVCSDPDSSDGAGEERTRQLSSAQFGGVWVSINALWGDFDSDAFIVPVIDTDPVSLDPAPTSHGLALMGAYPNPAADQTTIRYSLDMPRETHVRVFDLAAREIHNSGWQLETAGEHEIELDLSHLAPGSYYFTVKTKETALTSKFVVTK